MPELSEIQRAYEEIHDSIHVTPLLRSQTFSEMSGAHVYLKAENLQRAGSFKVRGATYKISRLSESERHKGVVAVSMGNHAQAVALAARSLGVQATIVMPEQAPLVKVMATRGYGAKVILHGATFKDAHEYALEFEARTGATLLHSFEDYDLITGQGTLGLEILEQFPDVEAIVVPIGGGGLISGVALAVKALRPDVRIIGVQAKGADAAKQSLQAGHIVVQSNVKTIADGICINAPGELTFAIMRKYVDEVVTVDDEEIMSAILLLLERSKLQVEAAGASGLAALLHPGLLDVAGKKVALVLTGGNIDTNVIGNFISHGLLVQGRITILRTFIEDRPGELKRLLTVIADQGANVRELNYCPTMQALPEQHIEVTLTLDTRDHEHIAQLLDTLHDRGYTASTVQVQPKPTPIVQ
nr:threonine ammonia-lyase [Thermosporothrix hazakensis]